VGARPDSSGQETIDVNSPRDPAPAGDLDRAHTRGTVYPVFQPIVTLASGRIAGYEALARGPAGSEQEMPAALFAQARAAGRLAELDWIARAAAFRAALAARLPYEVPLFVNIEPATLRSACPPELLSTIEAGTRELQVVMEITERALGDDPAALLTAVTGTRSRSARIALDDVGANPDSLCLLPLIGPEVIKIDKSIVQGRFSPAAARVVSAVLAESERTGAVILAEGIETERHLAVARSMGATLGQGWLLGLPAPLPERHDPPEAQLPYGTITDTGAGTPFEIASRHRRAARATKRQLMLLSRHLESLSEHAPEATVLLSTFQHAKFFDSTTRHRYADLAGRGALTAVFGQEMPPVPDTRLRGGALAPGDPLAAEWNVVVLGSYFAGGLFARERQEAARDSDREFDVIISYDRALITEAAHALLQRLEPVP
jgi:EAL domain-containing protein (putative c-di-GMP-specific phosphodiesterase class I)